MGGKSSKKSYKVDKDKTAQEEKQQQNAQKIIVKQKPENKPENVSAIGKWVEQHVTPFLNNGNSVPDHVVQSCVKHFCALSVEHAKFIQKYYGAKNPGEDTLKQATKAQETEIQNIANLKNKTSSDISKNFVSMTDAAVGAFAWFNIASPAQFVQTIQDYQDASVYYLNRVSSSISDLPSAEKESYKSLLQQFQKVLVELMNVVKNDYTSCFWKTNKNEVKAPINGSGKTQPATVAVKKLVDKKWVIENQTEFCSIDVSCDQRVYIYNCFGSKMEINGKANSITVDNCREFGFVFDSVIAQVEILNSTNVQGQMHQNCPSISIDGSSRITIFVSEAATENIEIFTSRVTDSTLQVRNGEEFKEVPIPEQFKTTLRENVPKTEPVQHM